jgi:hypothetical protein
VTSAVNVISVAGPELILTFVFSLQPDAMSSGSDLMLRNRTNLFDMSGVIMQALRATSQRAPSLAVTVIPQH